MSFTWIRIDFTAWIQIPIRIRIKIKLILDTAFIYFQTMIKFDLETGDSTGMREDHLMIHVQRHIWVNPADSIFSNYIINSNFVNVLK